jgi:hypothetical protein
MPIDPSIPGRIGVGVTPLNDPMQTLAQFSELANRRRLTDVAEADRLQQIQSREQATADQQQTAEAYRAAWKQQPDGTYELDTNELMKRVPAAGIPGVIQHAQAATTAAAARRSAQQAAKKAEQAMIANAAEGLAKANYDPAYWRVTLKGLLDAEWLEPEAYERLSRLTDPVQIESIVKTAMQQAGIKPIEPKLERVTTVDAQGNPVTQFVTPTPGASFPVVPPKPPTPQSVSTVDAQGRPVTRFVTPEAGASYPTPPPRQAPPSPVQVQTVDAQGNPVTQFVTPTPGTAYPRPPTAAASRPSTGAERKDLGFYNRMKEALDTLGTAGPGGAGTLEDQVGSSYLAQAGLKVLPNVAQSTVQQLYNQAQRAFTEARLRKESGAAIPEHEYANDARTYFVQPGDTPEVIAQKRAARQGVLESVGFSAGKAYEEYYGEPAPRAAASAAPKDGAKMEIPGHPGTEQTYNAKTGKWIRTK